MMSITYEIIAKNDKGRFPISSGCVSGISWLTAQGLGPQLAVLGLNADGELGDEQFVERMEMLEAIDQLLEPARKFPKGFQVRSKMFVGATEDCVGRGTGGLIIKGIMYAASCKDDHWILAPSTNQTLPAGWEPPPGMRGEPRHEPVELQTENLGIVKIELKEGRSDVAVLLSRIANFLKSVPDKSLLVVVG